MGIKFSNQGCVPTVGFLAQEPLGTHVPCPGGLFSVERKASTVQILSQSQRLPLSERLILRVVFSTHLQITFINAKTPSVNSLCLLGLCMLSLLRGQGAGQSWIPLAGLGVRKGFVLVAP